MDDIDDLLDEINLNYKPSTTVNRNRRSFADPPKLETQKITHDPYEFDSILKSQDSPIDKQPSFVPRQRPQTAMIDESKKQKMADLFQLPKTTAAKDLPPPPQEDINNDLAQVPSRRGKMRMLSQNKGTVQKSDINSSQDPIANNTQQIEVEKQSVQSDYSSKFKQPPDISVIPPPNTQMINEIKQLKLEKDKLTDDLQQQKNEKQKLVDDLENERREKQKLLQEKLESEKNFAREKEQIKVELEREKQRAIDAMKMESEIMRHQLGEQKQLDHLAEKINVSAKELEQLKNQLYMNNDKQANDKMRQLELKGHEIKDRETQLERDRSYLENEKKRLQNLQDDLSKREQLFQASIEGEKRSLQSEKQLLQDIKESLRTLEIETKKRLEQENLSLQRQKNEYEIYKNEMNSQAQSKMRQLDMERSTFEQEKTQYREFTHKNNEIMQQKYAEIEKQSQRNGTMEMQLISKQRDLDMKDNQVSSLHAELTRKIALVDNERQQLLQKLKEINEKEQYYHKEITNVQEFRQVYQQEKELIQRQKLELQKQLTANQEDKIQIEQEKNQLAMMHKTLSNLRQEITTNTMQGFSQTGTPMRVPPPPKPKVEKPRSTQNISTMGQSVQNFDVGSYVKYLKNVDYLH